VGVGCGATHGGQDGQTNAGWLDSFGRILVKQATIDDLVLQSGACSKAGDSLTVARSGGTCTVYVVDRRRISLTANQEPVAITVTQNKVGGPQKPKSDQTYEFILDKQPDQFVAVCLSFTASCVLNVNA
jgi:hypothetical protein